MRKLIGLAVPLGAVLALFTATAASATVPYTSYLISGGETIITINSNPSHLGVRAWEQCYNSSRVLKATKVGGWHWNVGEKSYSGACPQGTHTGRAGKDVNKSSPTRYICYRNGDPPSGGC